MEDSGEASGALDEAPTSEAIEPGTCDTPAFPKTTEQLPPPPFCCLVSPGAQAALRMEAQ